MRVTSRYCKLFSIFPRLVNCLQYHRRTWQSLGLHLEIGLEKMPFRSGKNKRFVPRTCCTVQYYTVLR